MYRNQTMSGKNAITVKTKFATRRLCSGALWVWRRYARLLAIAGTAFSVSVADIKTSKKTGTVRRSMQSRDISARI
jgi:hypothetical protein